MNVYTATLDRKPVEGFLPTNWYPGYWSTGSVHRLGKKYADAWAETVKALPPGGLAVTDREQLLIERSADGRAVTIEAGPEKDAWVLAMLKEARAAIGPGRPISHYIFWLYPTWYTSANLDIWLRRSAHLSRATLKRIESLKPFVDVCECMTLECYIGRAVGDPVYPDGTLDRDLTALAQFTELCRAKLGEDVPMYCWMMPRANAFDTGQIVLSAAETQAYARRVVELDLTPIVFDAANAQNGAELLKQLEEAGKLNQ